MSATVWSKYACSRAAHVAARAAWRTIRQASLTRAPGPEDASMPAIIPIPAFADNYIWLLRDGRERRGRRPGRRGARARIPRARRARARRDPGDAPSSRPRGRHRRAARAPRRCPCSGRPESDSRDARGRLRGRSHRRSRNRRSRSTCSTFPGTRLATSPASGTSRGCPVLFCGDTLFAAGCGRLFEGTPAQMWASLSKLAALPEATRDLLRARVHAREPALRAGGRAAERSAARARGPRDAQTRARRTDAALDDGRRARDQPVPARHGAGRTRRRQCATRGARSPIRWMRSPRCARGRTHSRRWGQTTLSSNAEALAARARPRVNEEKRGPTPFSARLDRR